MSGTLYIVPTPIGDLDDLSPRARAVLGQVALVAAEDTRVTRRLYEQLQLSCPHLWSYHDHNEQQRVPAILKRLAEGEDVALVSDAGTPMVSDPGYRLVVGAVAEGVQVVPLPGPTAVVTALSASGLPTDRFVFLGFLPRHNKKRAEALQARQYDPATVLFFEAPHRILETLSAIQAQWGERRVVVARSLTKSFEEFLRGSVAQVILQLASEERILGELTVVVEGFRGPAEAPQRALAASLITNLVAAGVSPVAVRDALAGPLKMPRREVYQQALAAKEP